jgi:hypothetical protein
MNFVGFSQNDIKTYLQWNGKIYIDVKDKPLSFILPETITFIDPCYWQIGNEDNYFLIKSSCEKKVNEKICGVRSKLNSENKIVDIYFEIGKKNWILLSELCYSEDISKFLYKFFNKKSFISGSKIMFIQKPFNTYFPELSL